MLCVLCDGLSLDLFSVLKDEGKGVSKINPKGVLTKLITVIFPRSYQSNNNRFWLLKQEICFEFKKGGNVILSPFAILNIGSWFPNFVCQTKFVFFGGGTSHRQCLCTASCWRWRSLITFSGQLRKYGIFAVTYRVTNFLPRLVTCYYFLPNKLNFHFFNSPIFGNCPFSFWYVALAKIKCHSRRGFGTACFIQH